MGGNPSPHSRVRVQTWILTESRHGSSLMCPGPDMGSHWVQTRILTHVSRSRHGSSLSPDTDPHSRVQVQTWILTESRHGSSLTCLSPDMNPHWVQTRILAHVSKSRRGSSLKGKERKGKERKSIYIAPFCTKVHTKRSDMDHTVLPANNTMPAFPESTHVSRSRHGSSLNPDMDPHWRVWDHVEALMMMANTHCSWRPLTLSSTHCSIRRSPLCTCWASQFDCIHITMLLISVKWEWDVARHSISHK